MFARQLIARGRVAARPTMCFSAPAATAVRHFSGNPMEMIQAQLAEATAKLQEIAKEPQQMVQPHLVGIGFLFISYISFVLYYYNITDASL